MLGQGAYGIVYKGRKTDTNEIVAIKRIPFTDSTPEGGVPCNVIREISLLRELDHPNVVCTWMKFLACAAWTETHSHTCQLLGETLGYYSSPARWLVPRVRICQIRSQELYGQVATLL